jgi:hypothetical protein
MRARYASAHGARGCRSTTTKDGRSMKVVMVVLLALVLVFGAFTWGTLHWSYSDGERSGFVQKFSRRGWLCKTWEGEMAMVTLPGTMAEKFPFTVRDARIAGILNANIGRRMTIHYEQRKWIPTSCFGDTEYFVTDARIEPQTP